MNWSKRKLWPQYFHSCHTQHGVSVRGRESQGFGGNILVCISLGTSLVAQTVKRLSTMRETWVQSLGWEDPLEKEMTIHSSTIAWKIPWTEEPGRLQSMGLQWVGHDWASLERILIHCTTREATILLSWEEGGDGEFCFKYHRLRLILRCQRRFVNCNKPPLWWGMLTMGKDMQVSGRGSTDINLQIIIQFLYLQFNIAVNIKQL